MGRIHLAGSRKKAEHRLTLSPEESTRHDIDHLLNGGYIGSARESAFEDMCNQIMDEIAGLFDDTTCQRIHGDCHPGNLLDRPDEGILVIDFDDMVNGPPVQDLWMLLPDHAPNARRELNLILEGYEQFMEFDDYSLRLIEPLRVMRILYFLAWCSRQVDDYRFQSHFPDWGSDAFWQREINDLQEQLDIIRGA
jgi:Ser/Thr protein kinase RdoA (MazF antagonist)